MHRRLRWQPSDCQLSLQGSKSFTWVEISRHRDKGSNQMTGATGDLCGRSDCGAGQCKSRENRLGELNTDLRSFPPSHATTADGCAVKHKIEGIGNSDVTLRTVQSIVAQRPLKVMRAFLRARRRRGSFRRSCFGLSIVRSSGHTHPGAFPVAVIAVACVVRVKTRSLGGQPCAGLVPLAIKFSVPFRLFRSAGRRALLNSRLPEDSISFCLSVSGIWR
jgi:hypothetical protein